MFYRRTTPRRGVFLRCLLGFMLDLSMLFLQDYLSKIRAFHCLRNMVIPGLLFSYSVEAALWFPWADPNCVPSLPHLKEFLLLSGYQQSATMWPKLKQRQDRFTTFFLRTLPVIHPILMCATLINFEAHASSSRMYVLLALPKDLLVRDTIRSIADPWSKKLFTASSTSLISMLGSMSEISTSILGMKWRTDPLTPVTSLKVESSRSLSFLEHLGPTIRSLERVSLISWRVTLNSSGLNRFFRSFNMAAEPTPSAGFISTAFKWSLVS